MHPVLQLVELRRTFRQGDREIPVLHGASAALYPGQAVALVGPSGAGKSTLLHIAGLLETPDGGQVIVNGHDCAAARRCRAHAHAARHDGLRLPVPPAAARVLGARERRHPADDRRRQQAGGGEAARKRAARACWGSAERLDHRPAQLSGGEQQRTAIARALANAPRLLLADEPTGNLDPETAAHVFHELLELIQHTGVAALIATHNFDLARRMHRVLRLQNGVLVEANPARSAETETATADSGRLRRISGGGFFTLSGEKSSLHHPPQTLCPPSEVTAASAGSSSAWSNPTGGGPMRCTGSRPRAH